MATKAFFLKHALPLRLYSSMPTPAPLHNVNTSTNIDAKSRENFSSPPYRSNSNFIPSMIVLFITGIGLYFYSLHVQEEINQKKASMASKVAGSYGEAKVGGPFSLVNHKNEPVTQESFYGNYLLIYFGFTNCPDICPDELDKLTQVINILDTPVSTRDKVLPIFLTVDPKRDSPSRVATYLKDFHPKFIGLTGPPDDIKATCKAYRVYYSPTSLAVPAPDSTSLPLQQTPLSIEPSETDDYLVDHSVFFYLMGPRGEFIEVYGRDLEAREIATKITAHISK